MIKLPLITDWNICTPTLFRFLESEFVDSFFKDGSLRLSSFANFKKHKDEQRLDVKEGKTMFVHRTNQGGGQTITAWATHGVNAYVLCAAMRYDKELMKSFNCDSYIRINNSTQFGMAVARHIPGVIAAFEGHCLYQEMKIVEQDIGYIDINQFRDPKNPENLNKQALNNFIVSRMQHYPLFLKEKSYAHQSEYRFVWITRNKINDFLDLKVPEAVQYCTKPNSVNE
jgi:hypothetical protein